MWQYNNELYHFGVLGMRWGHRKSSQPILKGRVMRATTTKKLSDNMFVSQTKIENEYWQSWLKRQIPNSTVINLNMKLKGKLIGPSEKERIQEMVKQLSDKQSQTKLKDTMVTATLRYDPTKLDKSKFSPEYREYLQDTERYVNNTVTNKIANVTNTGDKFTVASMAYTIYGNPKTRETFLNSFRDKGYDFVTDDAGNNDTISKFGIGTNAIILSKDSVNPKKNKGYNHWMTPLIE